MAWGFPTPGTAVVVVPRTHHSSRTHRGASPEPPDLQATAWKTRNALKSLPKFRARGFKKQLSAWPQAMSVQAASAPGAAQDSPGLGPSLGLQPCSSTALPQGPPCPSHRGLGGAAGHPGGGGTGASAPGVSGSIPLPSHTGSERPAEGSMGFYLALGGGR